MANEIAENQTLALPKEDKPEAFHPLKHALILTDSGHVFQDTLGRIAHLSFGKQNLYPPFFSDMQGEDYIPVNTEPNNPDDGSVRPTEAVALDILAIENSGLSKIIFYAISAPSTDEEADKKMHLLDKLDGVMKVAKGLAYDAVTGFGSFGNKLATCTYIRKDIIENRQPVVEGKWVKFGDSYFSGTRYDVLRKAIEQDEGALGNNTVKAILEGDFYPDYKRPEEIRPEEKREWQMRSIAIKHGAVLASRLYLEAFQLASKYFTF